MLYIIITAFILQSWVYNGRGVITQVNTPFSSHTEYHNTCLIGGPGSILPVTTHPLLSQDVIVKILSLYMPLLHSEYLRHSICLHKKVQTLQVPLQFGPMLSLALTSLDTLDPALLFYLLLSPIFWHLDSTLPEMSSSLWYNSPNDQLTSTSTGKLFPVPLSNSLEL